MRLVKSQKLRRVCAACAATIVAAPFAATVATPLPSDFHNFRQREALAARSQARADGARVVLRGLQARYQSDERNLLLDAGNVFAAKNETAENAAIQILRADTAAISRVVQERAKWVQRRRALQHSANSAFKATDPPFNAIAYRTLAVVAALFAGVLVDIGRLARRERQNQKAL